MEPNAIFSIPYVGTKNFAKRFVPVTVLRSGTYIALEIKLLEN